ncbi:MAG: DNA phosphorothioation-associated methyltransferase, partial [Snowella sp.]|nr:DNA phosphorothioation-associated methyltransferase [Snowella sp.]
MSLKNDDFSAIAELCQKSDFGKRLPNALYIHISALERLDPLLQSYEEIARKLISNIDAVTVIKFSTDTPKLSYLFYPDFDTDPHPALVSSMVVNLET